MERKYRKCSNSKCPSKKDSKGGFTKVGYKNDSMVNPYYCPYCRKKLPDYIPDIDPDADPNVVSTTKVSKIQKIKTILGGIRMNTKMNWKAIGLAILAVILLSIFVYTLITLSGPWGTIISLSIGLMFVGMTIASINRFCPRPILCKLANIFCLIGILVFIVAIIFTALFPSFHGFKTNSVQSTQTEQVKPTEQTNGVFSLGKPGNPEDVDPTIWNKPMEDGVMINGEGIVYYTQSGKNGVKLLKGQIPDGQTLVLDSFSLSKKIDDKLESYSGGNLLVIVGPLDLDTNPISYTNGAAQMIGTINLQKFLDQNVWVKFSRGDALKDRSAWSYKPWALSNIWLPEGYTFKKLGLTAKTDNYPNLVPPPIQ